MDSAESQIIERIRAVAREGTPLRLRGGGTKDFYGESLQGEILDTRPLSGILSYEPSELVVTVRAGTPLRDLDYAAIDLETTGFHAERGDEIVSMAAVRIVAGEIRRDLVFDRVVDPGRAIPPESSSVHGITDTMVSGQPRPAELLPALRAI